MIGKRLRKLRKEKGLLQKELAKKLDLSQQTISLYESNNREPDSRIVKKIANFFDVSIDYLYENTDERSPADKIKKALTDDPELQDAWEQISKRDSLKLLFKQSKNMTDKDIKQMIRIMNAINENERKNN